MRNDTVVLVLVMALWGSAGATAGEQVVSQGAVMQAELIFPLENPPTPGCHASTIVETRDGKLLAAWFAGTDEGEDDVGIWVSRWEKDAWSRPVEVANGVMSPQKRYPCWNPVLFQPRQGPLVLFFKVGPTPDRMVGRDDGLRGQRRDLEEPPPAAPARDGTDQEQGRPTG